MLSSRVSFHRCGWLRLSRRFCDKVKESPAQDLQDEKVKRKQEATKKLASLLETLNVEAQNIDDKSINNISLTVKLAKPSVKNKRLLKKAKAEEELESGKPSEEEDRESVEDIEPELVSAVRSVAKDIGGDAQRTESELMQKLRTQVEETVESRDSKKVLPKRTSKISDRLFKGMKFELKTSTATSVTKKQYRDSRAKTGLEPDQVVENGPQDATDLRLEPKTLGRDSQGISDEIKGKAEDSKPAVVRPESKLLQKMRAHMTGEEGEPNLSRLLLGAKIDKSKEPERQRRDGRAFQDEEQFPFRNDRNSSRYGGFRRDSSRTGFGQDDPVKHGHGERVNLFGSTPLNIFKTEKESETSDATGPVLRTWDALQEHELGLLVDHPPKNAYEEMIEWTEQGKFWKFPIDNEQGMEEEMKVGFEEHIFLESLLEGFPEKGPVRHFMELVTVGLSKNPYITAERKRENIEWFRQYFNEKEAILKELGAT